jgi:exonuclease SbcC
MRPRLLEVTAFGPFPGTVRVDFSELADHGLFLVRGPTGAGKTSLLDAMTYALYGGVAGTRRVDRLRSDHAAPQVHTAVAFEFSLRGEEYRVTRVPPHERAKKTGTGLTKQKAKATLSRHTGAHWEPIAEGVEEVGQHIIDLVGLNRDQFHQVVVLPQGDFAQALHADANERRRLLSSLFRTGRFEDYTQRLLDRAKEAEAEAATLDADVDRLVEQAAGRWSCILTGIEVVPDTVDEMALHASVAADTAKAAAAAALVEQQEAGGALETARLAAERHKRVARARAVLAELEAGAEEIDDVRRQLLAAERAEPLADYLTVAARAAAQAEDAAAAATSARATVAALADAADPPVGGLAVTAEAAETPAELTAVRDDLQALLATLRAAAQSCAEAQRLREQADQAQADAAAAAAALTALQAHGQELAAEHTALSERRDEALRAAQRVPGLQEQHQRLQEQAGALETVATLTPSVVAAAAATTDAKQRLNTALDEHRRLLEARIDGMAAELAGALVDGEPCGVCGSSDHPDPATAAGAGVTLDALEDAAAAADQARREVSAHEEAEAAMRAELALAQTLAGDADPATIAECLREVAQQLAADSAAAAEGPAMDARLAEIREETDQHLAETTRLTAAAAAATTTAAQCQEQAAALAAATAQAVGDVDPALAVRAAEDLLAAVTGLCGAVSDAQRHHEDAAAAQARLDDALARHDFTDAEQARASLLAPDIREQYRSTLAALDQRRVAAQAVLDEHADEHADDADEAPAADLRELQARCAAAQQAAQEAQQRLGVVRQAADDLAELATRWHTALTAARAAHDEAGHVRRLADICNGTGNAQRMSLERYVLAAYFEEIAEAASTRLQAMTDGRYTLRHSDERARGGAASGLSITVHDAFTGTERESGTLSGGETFQASLCLALAVADVVQRHAGGVHLDMLFIDEGFGALDAEALEQAMAELDALREGGRLVGVISHVPTLRERISGGIEVTKTATGSDARVVVLADI